MDQEETLDFKALRAKFQDEEILLKQPKIKPALPEKPRVLPPPHSPTHYLPAGARPSLLTSINQTVDRKNAFAPNVVFKDNKKDSKKPLIQPKAKEKSEGKLKGGKDKAAKGTKERLDGDGKTDLSDKKQKKESSKDKKLLPLRPFASKPGTAVLVPATAPPITTTPKKKGFLGFRKSLKKEVVEIPADPILDAPSPDIPGPAPLIPPPTLVSETPQEPPAETQTPKALMPPIPPLSETSAASAIILPSPLPSPTDIPPSPVFIPDIPAPQVPLEIKTQPEPETPDLPVSVPTNAIVPTPTPSPLPNRTQQAVVSPPPPPAHTPSPPPPSTSETEVLAVASKEEAAGSSMEEPPDTSTDSPSIQPSPKSECPVSALSVLERAEEMIPGKKTPPADLRILNALEKARKKGNSHLSTSTTSYPIIPPPVEPPPSPTSLSSSLPYLPPIDYDDQADNAPQVNVRLNGFGDGQAAPALEGIAEEESDIIPELLVVPPPPPPRKALPDPPTVGPVPQKPPRPTTVDLTAYVPPEENVVSIPAPPPEFSEFDTCTEVPEVEDVGSASPEVSTPDWGNGEYSGPDGHGLPGTLNSEYCINGVGSGADVHESPDYQMEFKEIPEPEPMQDVPDSSLVCQGPQSTTGPQAEEGICESSDNLYEDIASSANKKKGKSEAGKKRKGPPKNPYAETPQPANEEKSKMSRFGKNDKKTTQEGPDEKELKKKEKQRLEKEKKELKEQKEREKKEQKEREKKENEMKKKFRITGQEEAMYQAKVTVTTKGRRNDLPVRSGDLVSIIRTTSCPKGKWLARDNSNSYGYIAVDHVELDIQEMLDMGKKAAINRNNNAFDVEVTSRESRSSNHYPLSTGSFTDDSEEWTCDDDEPLSSPVDTVDTLSPYGHTRTHSMPEMGSRDLSIIHQHSHSDISTEGPFAQTKHEALHKLATFFHSPKPVMEEPGDSSVAETSPVFVKEEAVCPPESCAEQEEEYELPDALILPPPDLYADVTAVE